MNQFDKHQIISIDIQDPQQIESALIQYQSMLNDGTAFNKQQFDVEFKQQTTEGLRRLQPSDAGSNLELLKSALNCGQEGGSHYYNREITDDREVYISEPILFAAALQYPQIRPAVVATAKAIVAYSRRMNDTDKMWLDDMRVFGIEAIYILAKTDLQYAYLIGQFFIPYWDDEHATQYEEYLSTLLAEYGWHPEIIKAFIWCDNSSFRLGMFMQEIYSKELINQPLGEYLQQNPCVYASFKQMVIERFQAEPVLLTSINEHSDEEEDLMAYQPVLWLYQTLFAHTDFYDDSEAEDAFMQQAFIGSTLEDEAYDMQHWVQSQVSGPLVRPAESALQDRAKYRSYRERDDRRFEINYGSLILKPLIIAMPQGERLWRYIEDGSDIDALHALPEIEILSLAAAHAPEMAMHIDDFVHDWEYNNQGVNEELEDILSLVRGDLLTDHFGEETTIELSNGLVTTLTVTSNNQLAWLEERKQQYLRVVDVFYHALGRRELNKYMMESLTDDDQPLLSRQDYYRRYSQLSDPQLEQPSDLKDPALTRDVQSIFFAFNDRDELLYNKHFLRVESVLRPSRELCDPIHWDKPQMGFFALAAYQLYRDYHQQIGDEVTRALFAYIEQNNIWRMAVEYLLKQSFIQGSYHCPEGKGLSESDIERVRDYFCTEQPQEDQASLIALLEPNLQRDECCRGDVYINKFSEYQPGYSLFSDHDEDFQRFTLIAFWLRQLPLPQRVQADRLWQFVITLAPVRAARNVLRAYSEDCWDIEFNNVLQEIEISEQLEKAGIDAGILSAFEMSRQRNNTERYIQALAGYSEIANDANGAMGGFFGSMFGGVARKKAQALHTGLRFINESERVEFLHHASLRYPHLELDVEHEFTRALRIVTQLNLRSWEFALAHELGTGCVYVGYGDKMPQKLRRPIVATQSTIHDQSCYMDGASWMQSTIVQQRGEYYEILIADKELPLEIYEDALPRGLLVIVSADVEPQTVLSRFKQLQDATVRIEHIVAQTLAYLNGDVEYAQIHRLYAAQIETENFRSSVDEYRLYTLKQLLWMLPPMQRNRLLHLMLNHDYRGFKLLEGQHEKAWLLELLQQGEIDFEQYLEQEREEESSENGMHFLLKWLVDLEVNPAHITLFCIKNAEFAICCDFIQHHARGNFGRFADTLDYLHAGRRAQLPQILSQAEDGAQLVELLSKDKSRVVKEAVAKYLVV